MSELEGREGRHDQGQDWGATGSEPSVLDWFKSLFSGEPLPIPELEDAEGEAVPVQPRPRPEASPQPAQIPIWERARDWLTPANLRMPVALFLALVAQFGLQQRGGAIYLNVAAYVVAAGLVVWALWEGDLQLLDGSRTQRGSLGLEIRTRPLIAGLGFALLTFLTAYDNQFRLITVLSWGLALCFTFVGLWQGERPWAQWRSRLRAWLADPGLEINLSGWHFVMLGTLGIVAYFRYAELATVPYEMWSDQAEKLLDVRDVLNGDHKIFFARNSGREAIEFYLAALTATGLGTGLSFLTLKLVAVSAGFLALAFIYLLTDQIGGRAAGLYALLLAGIAFWPNIAARSGLRMPLNELAVAPAMFFLVRGLRQQRRNDFLWAGLAVGLGLHGYSGARVLPLVIVVGVLVYLLHLAERGRRLRVLVALGCLVLVSVVAFMPLLRVLVDSPDLVLYRTLTRMGTAERAYPNPVPIQLAINMWDVLRMFSWDTGQIWVVTVPGRPALDWVSGVFFHLGLVMMAVDYVRRRRWESLFVLASLPILLLPSALALAFPNENPAPNRVTGAIVPVFAIAGYAVAVTARWLRERLTAGRARLAYAAVGGLLLLAALSNHRLVFDTYAKHQRKSAWNNSEAGAVMRGFADSLGAFEDIYFVAYPFWMDSRLAAIEAGAPLRDYSIQPEALPNHQLDPERFHLYLLKPEDVDSISQLQRRYPEGVLTLHRSEVPGRDFYLFMVPAASDPVGAADS